MTDCNHCGSEIVGRRTDAKYCSNVCSNRARNKKHYDNNPEKFDAKRKWENSHTEQRILYRVKSRAKKAGIPFNIGISDIVIPDVCPILGIKLVLTNQGKGYHTNSPSLDRINPTLGYIKGNVRVISARANLLKNDATSHEIHLILADLEALGQ